MLNPRAFTFEKNSPLLFGVAVVQTWRVRGYCYEGEHQICTREYAAVNSASEFELKTLMRI